MTDQKIRVSKEFTFEAAHALDGYDGKCKDIHGHSYHLTVTVLGIPKQEHKHPQCGMVIDFSDLKAVVKNNILSKFDHILVLRNDSRFKGIEETNNRVRFVPYQPTCENMMMEIVEILKAELPKSVSIHSVKLRETGTSYCEWYASENSI
ncbi:MAG: 6-carboxytetrahydropterin synthase [Flavobacteriales bacterium]|nr:6-carboxytetrahydropterin synthase [Flavobacteriales bacterium]